MILYSQKGACHVYRLWWPQLTTNQCNYDGEGYVCDACANEYQGWDDLLLPRVKVKKEHSALRWQVEGRIIDTVICIIED